jgi:GT2 family glycosyltransferase
MKQTKEYGVSVVIPTLGGDFLAKTIHVLNNGTIVPDEILVCIPEGYEENVSEIYHSNIQVLLTKVKGQVAQRAEGFKAAKNKFVMQLDDDMLVSDNLVENLIKVLNSRTEKSVVSPGYFDLKSGNSLHRKPKMGASYRTYLFLINGTTDYIEGTVTNSGLSFGVDTTIIRQDVLEAEWVPGGCLMHRKENLIVENYFPFKGKAYCEDLIQSYLLKANGIKLLVSREAQCWTKLDSSYQSFSQLLNQKLDELRKRKYFIKLSGSNLVRMYVFFSLNMVYSAAKYLNKKYAFQ